MGQLTYNIAAWNCASGLLGCDGSPTDKVVDAHKYICDHNLHLLAISECDFFDISHKTKHKKFTKGSREDALAIPGYDVWFPKQWQVYGHARIILLIKSDLAIKEIVSPAINDLPVIMVEVGTQRKPKTKIGFLYIEYTNYVTGLNTL